MSERLAKRVYLVLLLLPIILGLIFGRGHEENLLDTKVSSTTNSELIPSEFFGKINTNQNIVVLDIRPKEEYQAFHIKNSINIDLYKPDFEHDLRALNLDTNLTYLVYCKDGTRSPETISKLKDMGIEKAYNLSGGIDRWVRESYDVASN